MAETWTAPELMGRARALIDLASDNGAKGEYSLAIFYAGQALGVIQTVVDRFNDRVDNDDDFDLPTANAALDLSRHVMARFEKIARLGGWKESPNG